VGGALIVWALAHPASLIYFYKPWMKLAEGLGLYQHAHYLCSFCFTDCSCPWAFVMRLAGKDPMHRQLNAALDSYRVTRNNPVRQHMEKPY
jgi:hypothetical protein